MPVIFPRIPKDFNPAVPDRGTPEFNAYAASVMLHNRCVAFRRHKFTEDYALCTVPMWNWHVYDYASIPEPKPVQYVWPTEAQWLKRFADLEWQAVLVRNSQGSSVRSARLTLVINGGLLVSYVGPNLDRENFTEYQISLNAGQTWRSAGIADDGSEG